jgi:Domain of unknown function (DUF5666)
MTVIHLRICTTLLLAGLFSAGCGTDGLDAGINDTGMPVYRDVVSIGRVRSLGQLEVNGVRYDASGATVNLDGAIVAQSDLAVGDVVLLQGRFDPDAGSGTARRIESVHVVQGKVESLDAANGEMEALGQKIVWSDDPEYGDSLAGAVNSLHVGDPIRVAGFRSISGDIVATRIERQPSPDVRYGTFGAITSVADDGRHLSINDLVVDYSAVLATPAGMVRGRFVVVEGSLKADGTLVASRIESSPNQLDLSEGVAAHLEGYLTGLDIADPNDFEVEGVRVSMSGATNIRGQVNTSAFLEIKGSVGASGAVVASHISSASPFWSPDANRTVTGRVIDSASGPVGGGVVDLWVALANGKGYSDTWENGRTPVNSGGRFTINVPEGSRLLVNARRTGYVQPCSQIVETDTNPSFDIEIVAESTFDSVNPPLPRSAAGKSTFTGNVHEQTASGTQPVSGVALSFWWMGDLFTASTVSDLSGHYFACDLPRGLGFGDATTVWATKAGYRDVIVDVVLTDPATVFDFEMKRR